MRNSEKMARMVQEQRHADLRKRGDPKTQTSDARFDAQFAVMHGMSGQVPWYARQSMSSKPAAQQRSTLPPGSAANAPAGAADRGAAAAADAQQHQSPVATQHGHESKRKSHKDKKSKSSKSKYKKRSRHRSSGDSDDRTQSPVAKQRKSDTSAFESLRQERLAREAAEASRSRALMKQHFTK